MEKKFNLNTLFTILMGNIMEKKYNLNTLFTSYKRSNSSFTSCERSNTLNLYLENNLDNILIMQPKVNTYPKVNNYIFDESKIEDLKMQGNLKIEESKIEESLKIIESKMQGNLKIIEESKMEELKMEKSKMEELMIEESLKIIESKMQENLKIIEESKIEENLKIIEESKIEESKDIVIIVIDFINSTDKLINDGIHNFINLHKKFNKDLLLLINDNKYIKIYEIIGDSYILTLNFSNIKQTIIPATLTIIFLNKLINNTNNYIDIKIGISYNKCYYTLINNHIRIFGEGIVLASRLENQGSKDLILCCQNFYDQIIKENIINIIFTKKLLYLKGIGNYNCYIINMGDNKNIKYN